MEYAILGPLEVIDGGRRVDLGRGPRAVLAALLLEANRVVSVDSLLDVLWGDRPPQAATATLQVYVSNLRRALEPDRAARAPATRVITQPPGYRLDVRWEAIDAKRFEACADRGQRLLAEGRLHEARQVLAEGLDLWRGAALAEFATEPFAQAAAARLEERHAAALELRVEADLALGAHRAVIAELEGMVAARPLSERRWGLLALALYRSGRQGEALRALARARAVLVDELGISLSHDLRALEADILAQSPALQHPASTASPSIGPDRPPPPSSTLVGREDEIASIDEALERAQSGRGGVMLIAGEAGIGKTRLIEELAVRATDRGLSVTLGRAYEGEGAPPLWPWTQILRGLLAMAQPGDLRDDAFDLAPLLPEVKELVDRVVTPPAIDATAARFRFYEAVCNVALRLGSRRPLVVVVDDLHWADRPSLQLMAHFGQRAGEGRVLLVGAYRPTDRTAALDDSLGALARLRRLSRIELRGLTEACVGAFIAKTTGLHATTEQVAEVYARTGGNPFFVAELARLLAAEGDLAVVPAGVRDVIRRRLAGVGVATVDVLEAGAVAGDPFQLAIAAAATGRALDDAVAAVDAAVALGIVVEDQDAPGRLTFSHALVQETLYADLTGLRRARLHARVGDAIAERPDAEAHLAELALHFARAVPAIGTAKAIEYAFRAAEAAQAVLGYEAAEAHLRRALEMLASSPAGPERDLRELEAVDRLATLLIKVKGLIASEAPWKRALELSTLTNEPRRLLRSLSGLLAARLAQGDIAAGGELAGRIHQLGQASGDRVVIRWGDVMVGSIAFYRGELAVAAARLEAALATDGEPVAQGTGHPDRLVRVGAYLAPVLWLRGDDRRAAAVGHSAVARARHVDEPVAIGLATLFDGLSHAMAGDVTAAGRRADELLVVAEEYRMADFLSQGRLLGGWATARRGDVERGLGEITDALATLDGAGFRVLRTLYLALLADVCLRHGRLEEAAAAIDDGLAHASSRDERFYEAELWRMRAATLTGQGPFWRPEAMAAAHQARDIALAQGAVNLHRRAQAELRQLAPALG